MDVEIPTTVVSFTPMRVDLDAISITAMPTSHAGDVPVSTDCTMTIVTSIQLSMRFPALRIPSTRRSITGSKSGRQYTTVLPPALHRSTVVEGTWIRK